MTKQQDYAPYLLDDSKQYITEEHPPVVRHIVCAANRHCDSGILLVGSRHWSKTMVGQWEAMNIERGSGFDQGFIDQYDQYLSRDDAKRIALKNGQPLVGDDWGQLYSENLY